MPQRAAAKTLLEVAGFLAAVVGVVRALAWALNAAHEQRVKRPADG